MQRQLEDRNQIAQAFDDVTRHLADLDIDEMWQEVTDEERRILASDLIDGISFFPDHLEVKVAGAPKMNVTLQEVGLTGGSVSYGVGEPSVDATNPGWRLREWAEFPSPG